MAQSPLQPPPDDPPMAQPLEYAMPAPRRPGLVTAIGVLSIVLGSLGIFTSGLGGLYAFGISMFIAMSSMMPWGAMTGGSLLPQEQQAVVSALTRNAALSAAEQANLKSLLDEHGSAIFDRTQGPISAARVTQDLKGWGTSAAAAGPSAPPGHWYTLASGRIELEDDYAAFYAPNPAAPAGPPAVKAEALDTPTQAQVDLAADEIAKMAAAPPDARQTQAIKNILGQGSKLLRPSSDRRKIRMQVAGMAPASDGGMTLSMANGSTLYLPPSGGQKPIAGFASPASSTTTVVGPNGTVTTTTTATGFSAAGGAGPKFGPELKIGAILAMIEAVLSFGLAIYLLVIGILVFRWSRRGTAHHLIYAWAKLLLAVLFVGAWWMVIKGFVSGLSSMPAARMAVRGQMMAGAEMGMLVWLAVPAALSLIYPIALLIALRSRTVRTYYQTIGT